MLQNVAKLRQKNAKVAQNGAKLCQKRAKKMQDTSQQTQETINVQRMIPHEDMRINYCGYYGSVMS
ncbi:MAG: hypothetical protein JSV82_06755 [Planctomycetota bacterium]|nr:MAG: hypothetical protein JSV82_06755 [Planctomycetota bacterium]